MPVKNHPPAGAPGAADSPAFAAWLGENLSVFSRNSVNGAARANIRHARAMLAAFFAGNDEDTIKRKFSNDLAKLHLSLANSEFRVIPPGEEEEMLRDRIRSLAAERAPSGITPGHLLAAMLYFRPEDPALGFLERDVPDWLYGVYTAFLAMEPTFFADAVAAASYREFAARVTQRLHAVVMEGHDPASPHWSRARMAAHSFSVFSTTIHPYFGDGDLRQLSECRAAILEWNARAAGLQLDWQPGPSIEDRTKIRLGIVMPHFAAKTETFATLPVFEHLDRERFDIRLYAIEAAGSDLEKYCASRADRVTVLSRNPLERASTIRGDRLDILFFGSNLTAVADECATLALHRLAPIQAASICCPISTGMPNMDYYIAGDLLAPAPAMQPQFREKLVNIPGSGLCFSFGPEAGRSAQAVSRQRLGIADDAVCFVSGANYFKITPEVRQAWASIIARVPGSVLVLYPFNPNWSSQYDHESFVNDIKRRFAALGLDQQRLRILKPLAGRADIKALLALADVYLDSFPYGGATSLVDTLESGLPPVVFKGNALRFRQAAMLEELSIRGLTAESEDSYIELACGLGTDAVLRRTHRDAIRRKTRDCPPFRDSRVFSHKIAGLFLTLHQRATLQQTRPRTG